MNLPSYDHLDMDALPSENTNLISLIASQDSRISNVNLYPGHAEITRVFKFLIQVGQNRVDIRGLPLELQEDSLLVEGQGKTTIHDVVVSKNEPNAKTSAHLKYSHANDPLKRKREETKKKLKSAKQARLTLDTYLQTINAKDADLTALETMLDGYGALARKIDGQILDTEKEVSEVEQQIQLEANNSRDNNSQNLAWQASIKFYGEVEKEVTILLKYVANNADWTPSYEIQTDTQTKENLIKFIYKASIAQRTYELWENVPLTLETATPTLALFIPHLSPWTLQVYQPPPVIIPTYRRGSLRRSPSPSFSPRRPRPVSVLALSPEHSRTPSPSPIIHYEPINVSDKGNIVAAFRIPGLVTVPSDTDTHNHTIAQLDLEATLLWYTMPKADTRVHLKAKIKNSSDYSFIPGQGKVYLDGSFFSMTQITAVSPQDTFDCSLGLDSAIRVIYHPREKKAGQSGIYSKTTKEAFTQRITIHNTKSTPIENLNVIDVVPVSGDQRIEVHLLNPALPTPASTSSPNIPGSLLKSNSTKHTSLAESVQVAPGVVAHWHGAGEPEVDQTALGKDGMISWLVNLASQETITLVLQYEVDFPEGLFVPGL